jgi:hypothetical protein
MFFLLIAFAFPICHQKLGFVYQFHSMLHYLTQLNLILYVFLDLAFLHQSAAHHYSTFYRFTYSHLGRFRYSKTFLAYISLG